MTEQEIITRLAAIEKAMAEKGLPSPEAMVQIKTGRHSTHVQWKDASSQYGTRYKCQFGDTVAEALDSTDQWIAALPDPEILALATYRNHIAKALDTAKDDGVDDKYLEGTRASMAVVSEALLPAPEGV